MFNDNKYLCPDFQEIRLRGDMLTKKYQYAEVRIKGCNHDVCQDEKMIEGYQIHLLLLNAYIDLVNNQNFSEDDVKDYMIDGRKFIYLE